MGMKKIVAGVDIGGTNTVFGLIDAEGKILKQGNLKTTQYKVFEDFVYAVFNGINVSTEALGGHYELVGIGIGAPMGNKIRGTIENAAGLPWKEILPLAGVFSKHTDLPVIITNDANAAAVGEMIFGAAKGVKNFVMITLGTGLGCGIVIDGKLFTGHNGYAGEIGHTSLFHDGSGRDCGCGKKGCLETYVSASGIKRTFLNLLSNSTDMSRLRDYPIEEIDSAMIFQAAKEGDKLAEKAFHITGEILGFKIADIVAHTDPEAIYLFGGLALSGDLLLKPARDAMEKNLLSVYKERILLKISELLDNNAAVLGAGSLVWSHLNI
jgi:glucokinase